MRETQASRLFRAVTEIGDDLIEEAGAARVRKKIPEWKRELVAGLCLIALAGAGVWRWLGRLDHPIMPEVPPAAADGPMLGGPDADPGMCGPACGPVPGGITPELRVGGTLYQYAGMSARLFLDPGGSYSLMGDGSTYLPEGYEPCGRISGITMEEPVEDFQLRAGFEAGGTVFASGEHPAVVYVLLCAEWTAEQGSYVRFVSDELGDNELLSWQGQMYRFSSDYEACELLEELPAGCELAGTLRFVGKDSVPAGDLETNRRGDNYAKPTDGREVYVLPGDSSVLYVYEHHYWAGGDYPAWRACHLWER